MYYVQSAPLICFIITALRLLQRWFKEWHALLGKDNINIEVPEPMVELAEDYIKEQEKEE